MSRDRIPEQHAFDFRQTGQGQQAIPPRKTLAPGTGNYYQQKQGNRDTTRAPHHRNVERFDRPARTGRPGREEYAQDYLSPVATIHNRHDTGLDTRAGQGRRYRVDTYYHNEPLDTEEQPASPTAYEEPGPRKHIHLHWFVYVGVGLILMLAGYIAFNLFGAWWQVHQDDVTYGNPRTFQTDAVVGHSDSAANPMHFIALNLKGQVIVTELPGGGTTKARIYNVTTIPDNSSNPPVKLVFQDLNHDGKLDMVIEIGDPGSQVTIFLYNNGSQFVPKL